MSADQARPDWSVAQAKQRFSELMRAAQREPQHVASRGRAVAVVLAEKDYAQWREWHQREQAPVSSSRLARTLAELRLSCLDDGSSDALDQVSAKRQQAWQRAMPEGF